MPYFTYKAKDSKGELINGTLEADSQSTVISRLQTMGYFPLEIVGAPEDEEPKALGERFRRLVRTSGKIKTNDLTIFYRQMSDLVSAGVPLVKSLGIVKTQSDNDALRRLLSKVDQDVQGGDTFARALGRHPQAFDKLSVAMVRAGEAGGLLEETLDRLADFAEQEEEVRGRVRSALAYPVIMIIAGGLAVGVLVTFVIPRIVTIFEDLQQTLPLMTQILIGVTDFLSTFWLLVLGAGFAAAALARRYVSTEAGRIVFHRALLKIPVLGEVILKREIARFTRTLGSLVRNGVPILNALDIASEVLTNVIIREEIARIPEGITQGAGMAGTLRGSQFFPPVVINMIAIGEETGNLHSVLLKVASSYEVQVDRSVKTLTSIIEPLIILVMGLLVGFIVISMLLPIFELDPTKG